LKKMKVLIFACLLSCLLSTQSSLMLEAEAPFCPLNDFESFVASLGSRIDKTVPPIPCKFISDRGIYFHHAKKKKKKTVYLWKMQCIFVVNSMDEYGLSTCKWYLRQLKSSQLRGLCLCWFLNFPLIMSKVCHFLIMSIRITLNQ